MATSAYTKAVSKFPPRPWTLPLSNRVFDTYTAILDACCDAWNALIALPKQIHSIASRKWAQEVRA